MNKILKDLFPVIRDAFMRVEEETRGARDAHYKADGSPVTVVDQRMQEVMAEVLVDIGDAWPMLGEEMEPEEQQTLLDRPGEGLWILDPLDGTTNFAAGVPLYAVSLALVDEAGARLGLIYDPNRDECFTAERGVGAWMNGRALCLQQGPEVLGEALAVVDGKRLSPDLAAAVVTNSPFASQRNFGSVALEWCWLAAGRVHIYMHGGQKLWDHAAGVLILKEAGGVATTMQGSDLHTQDLQPRSAVGAVNARLHARVMQWLEKL